MPTERQKRIKELSALAAGGKVREQLAKQGQSDEERRPNEAALKKAEGARKGEEERARIEEEKWEAERFRSKMEEERRKRAQEVSQLRACAHACVDV